MELNNYKRFSNITQGYEKADLVFKNASIINVFTEEIIQGDIAIADGIIVGIGKYQGIRELDMEGNYICPGFIDSHLHLESTLVHPGQLIEQAALKGTTTFLVDPHESANVAGMDGIDYILDQTKNVPANVFVMLPSCVPSSEVDDNACTITAEMMKPYLENPRILGLGEVMDYRSVVEGSRQMHEKLELFKGKVRDGHAPFLQEQDLQAYVMAGIATDHECSDFDYALRERRNGMTVLIRQGSAARNLEAIVKGIVKNQLTTEGFCFCTDDKHIEDIKREGHIDCQVRQSIALGIKPIQAIKMATLHPAKCYGLSQLGAIAPGYQADLIVFQDLNHITIKEVYHKGRKVETRIVPAARTECPEKLKNTIHIGDFTKDKLKLTKAAQYHVIQMENGQISTKDLLLNAVDIEHNSSNFLKVAAIERHKATGKVGVGLLCGYGLVHGAVASTVSHDSHNIIVIGDNDEDMELAVQELLRVQGGYTLVAEHQVYDTLRLSIMGLMTDQEPEEVDRKLAKMKKKAHEMGVPEGMDPFISLSFLALPVIPEIRITPRGVYSVEKGIFYN